MKFSEQWLREWVAVPADRAGLTHRLTMSGLEVESVEALGAGLDGVLVAEIQSAEKHPNADRLRVCQVSIGAAERLQIVCGAPNARVGLKAPLAMVGATLPGGLSIKAAQLRGVDSQGMLCSAKELDLDADASGLLELPADAPVGQSLATYLGLPDAIIELGLTPNRSDCLGMRGLAMEVAAEFGVSAKLPTIEAVAASHAQSLPIQLTPGAGCPRYLGRVIEGLAAGAVAPDWMQARLKRAGLRPINALVDVTNYVMLELGQPLHAFDADAVEGGIVVRRAQPGETLELLVDARQVALDAEYLVIADQRKALALAGVMGGHASRVTESTTRVFLESAHFDPAAISGRARRLGMHTDASHRFERGVDPELPRLAMERATALLVAIAGGRAGPVIEAVLPEELPRAPEVLLRRARLARVLGLSIPDAAVTRILGALGMTVREDAQGWRVQAPSWRFDIAIEEDLIEEVARIHGYDEVPVVAPRGELVLAAGNERQTPLARLRERLAAQGVQEAITFAFGDAGSFERWGMSGQSPVLSNPLSAELAVMRPSLLPGLVAAVGNNLNRQQERVRLYEVGRCFASGAAGPVEERRLAIALCGPAQAEQWDARARPVDFYDLKGLLQSLLADGGADLRVEPASAAYLHPGRSAELWRAEQRLGWIGALHPSLARALDLDTDVYVAEVSLDALCARALPKAAEVSRFPSVRRDLALVVSEAVAYADLAQCVRRAAGSLLSELRLFDLYRGATLQAGCKSFAIGLILQDDSRTLGEAEVDQLVAAVVDAAKQELGAQLR